MQLQEYLEEKPLYYKEIDYERMPRVWGQIKEHFKLPKIIHIIGTNGKGTTGRFLATALWRAGKKTGHYTSPHIRRFHERIWIDGSDVGDALLESAHADLQALLSEQEADSLSYFEYTTLLAMVVFSKKCDYVVLEAGLGGEHDATAVFENILTLVTPIAKDHEAFLGSTIREIATSKLNAIQKRAILAFQSDATVYEVAQEIVKQKGMQIFALNDVLEQEAYVVAEEVACSEAMPHYLEQNLLLAIGALELLDIDYTQESFTNARLFGRLSQIASNIIVDVGHNLLAAKAIHKEFAKRRYRLVYNSYEDKAYKAILHLLREQIEAVEIIAVEDPRVVPKEKLVSVLEELGLPWSDFRGVQANKEYLVFGSFSVVEKFLEAYDG